MPELYCSFNIYKLQHVAEEEGYVRIYVDIIQDKIYDGVPYLDSLDLSYTSEQYTILLEENRLTENLALHYLDRQVLSRDLDAYYH